jgi:hypothetical protein
MATSGRASTQGQLSSGQLSSGQCESCSGTGEVGTEVGPVDCPDCGGSGVLPHPNVLVEWRVRDIEKARIDASDAASSDIRWLIAELRRARTALTEIASLADDAGDSDIAQRIRVTAGQALALFELGEPKQG